MADGVTFFATIALAAATPTNLKTALLAAGFTGDPGLKELTITNNGALALFQGGADPTTGYPIPAGQSMTMRASGPSDLIQSAMIYLQAAGVQNVAIMARGL